MTRVIVHIDRLVLCGFRAEDQHAIAAGLQQQLGRALATREALALLTAKGDVRQMKVGSILFEHGSKPQQLGERVAHSIGQEMKK
ncbi:MAG: hypothetical protein ACWA6Y_01280 [Polaromonas sp.]